MTKRYTRKWLEQHRVDPETLGSVEVIGIGHVTRELDAIAARLTEPERAATLGLQPPRGVLLWGAPGLGKTLSARYLATRLGDDVPFYELPPDELSPERLRGAVKALSATDEYAVCMIDEVDSFAIDRDSRNHQPDTRALLSAALSILDGLTPRKGPLLIATSNRMPRELDPAFVRAGRFDLNVAVRHPIEPERLELLQFFARELPLADDVDLERAAQVTRGTSPAELKGICEDGAAIAFGYGLERIDGRSLREALDRAGTIYPDPVAEPEIAPEVLERASIHEAGHAVVAAALYGIEHVRSIKITRYGGHTDLGDEDRVHLTQRDLRQDMVICFGGISAERELLGDGGAGSEADMVRATEISVRTVGAGLSDAMLPVAADALDTPMPSQLLDTLGFDLELQFAGARNHAEALIGDNIRSVEGLAAILAEERELSGTRVQEAFEEVGVPRFRPDFGSQVKDAEEDEEVAA